MTTREPNPFLPCPVVMDRYKQNKPTLVARDLEKLGVPRAMTYAVLMARGVMKWLTVRRDVIALKNFWRNHLASVDPKTEYGRGYHDAMRECHAKLRALCHSSRWRV